MRGPETPVETLVVTQILQGDISQEATSVYVSDANKSEPHSILAVATRRTADGADERGYDEAGINFRPVAHSSAGQGWAVGWSSIRAIGVISG